MAKASWQLLLGIMNKLGYARNWANPCLYYKWDNNHRLILWLSFIDDMLIVCCEAAMSNVKKQFTDTVDCNNLGPMQEYIWNEGGYQLNQQKLKNNSPSVGEKSEGQFNFTESNA